MEQSFFATASALIRYRIVSYVELLKDEGCSLGESLTKAAQRLWPNSKGRRIGRSTIERWWYCYSYDGFSGLLRRERGDRGSQKVLSPDECCCARHLAAENLRMSFSQIHRRICSQRSTGASRPSYAAVRRYLNDQGLSRGARADLSRSMSQQAERAAEQEHEVWMQGLFHCKIQPPQIASELGKALPALEVQRLYECVKTGSLRYRKRAFALLCHEKGIKTTLIRGFLAASPDYVDRVVRQYRQHGLDPIICDPRKSRRKKHEETAYKEAIFAILHSPPMSHGINRTTWRTSDIRKLMSEQGLAIGVNGIRRIISNAGYTVRKAKVVLTSNDPDYEEKIQEIIRILAELKPDEKFFSVDEFGPFAVKRHGGRSLMRRGETKTVPQHQESKGTLIVTAALELSENQVTHFYSEKKNTDEMLRLLDILLAKYSDQSCIYLSWDAASWHLSKKLGKRVEENNDGAYRMVHPGPMVKLAPLPSCAQFLNVIESVFSGMAKAVIHNSDYQSVDECKAAIDRHFGERNQHFKENPKRAGGKIWGKELIPATFHRANNCKEPHYGWPF
jgi:transposase